MFSGGVERDQWPEMGSCSKKLEDHHRSNCNFIEENVRLFQELVTNSNIIKHY